LIVTTPDGSHLYETIKKYLRSGRQAIIGGSIVQDYNIQERINWWVICVQHS